MVKVFEYCNEDIEQYDVGKQKVDVYYGEFYQFVVFDCIFGQGFCFVYCGVKGIGWFFGC